MTSRLTPISIPPLLPLAGLQNHLKSFLPPIAINSLSENCSLLVSCTQTMSTHSITSEGCPLLPGQAPHIQD